MSEEKINAEIEALAKIQEAEQDALLVKENVVGIAIGDKVTGGKDTGDQCITVLVSQKIDDPLMLKEEDRLPSSLGKYKTDVVESGEFLAGDLFSKTMADDIRENAESDIQEDISIESLKNRIRPVEGGYSIGHYKITAGTYATAVTDRIPFPGIPRKYYVLSNNHVMANSNNARVGDPILQPGPFDGGRFPRDMIARLSRWVPIKFGRGNNYVDAAIAEGPFHYLDREIYWIGYVKGVRTVRKGEIVQKCGRTTNYTTGRVTYVNGTVNVNYGSGRVARFVRQILTTNMSAGGDSGSLLCDMNENAVGLLFAGSSSITIHNNILYVQKLLGIRIV